MGKIFDNPAVAMDEAMLRPETQDLAVFVDGVDNIVEAQQQAARHYLEDGSIEDACPPLKALLNIMALGHHEGKDVQDPAIRAMFTRDYLLASDWYAARLKARQDRDLQRWERHCHDLESFLNMDSHQDVAVEMKVAERLQTAESKLASLKSPDYLAELVGTIGADLLGPYPG